MTADYRIFSQRTFIHPLKKNVSGNWSMHYIWGNTAGAVCVTYWLVTDIKKARV